MEWTLFKKIPQLFLASTIIPVLISLIGRLQNAYVGGTGLDWTFNTVDIYSIAIAVTLWTAVFTLAIGCVVVIIMKGPVYVADTYKMEDANYPVQDSKKKKRNTLG